MEDSLPKLKTFTPGESFGEIPIIFDSNRINTIICDEDSYFLTIDKK